MEIKFANIKKLIRRKFLPTSEREKNDHKKRKSHEKNNSSH